MSTSALALGRIFSGIQPSAGTPHIGNYIGAIKPWVSFQKVAPLPPILSIVDLHALTSPKISPKQLNENILQMTASLLACGLDPQKCIIFQQSSVKQHCELAWILTCCSTVNRLQQLHAWREKVKKLGKDYGFPLGILMYPVLMASDILLYKTDTVPVGEDQTQHIELTRELAVTFNNRYKANVFTVPNKLVHSSHTSRIKSLRNPSVKMSKSEENENSYVTILDNYETISSKIKKSVTDSNCSLFYDPETRPGVSNLISIYSCLSERSIEDVGNEIASWNTVQLKENLSHLITETFDPIRKEHSKLMADKSFLVSVLKDGDLRATAIAESTLSNVKELIGVKIQ